jgi:NAD(P)-dependent dehydrogenase (short-subunit alcohol dehydrogenase family)
MEHHMENSIGYGPTEWLALAERICVVTGGGGGIGAETARELAGAGAWVAVVDRDEGLADGVATEIERGGGRAIGVRADVANVDSVAAAAQRVQKELGPCGVLVNNAAIRHRNPLIEIDLDTWNGVLAVNLTGALLCSQAFGAQMIAAKRGGSLIHVASLIGHYAQSGSGAYCVSKAGLMMLSRALAVELGQYRIRSNVVSPGMTRTSANEAAYRNAEYADARARLTPSGRVGLPADLAHTITFLASHRSEYINAQEIVVDGGMESTLMDRIPRAGKPASGA